MKTLKSVVDERMIEVEKQVRADYKQALSQMSKAEKESPDAVKRLTELVAIIEAKRAEDKLESFEKLAKILAGASDDMKQALADIALKNFERGQDQAYQRISESLDRLGYNLYGRSWVESEVERVLVEQYGEPKKRGNGHG